MKYILIIVRMFRVNTKSLRNGISYLCIFFLVCFDKCQFNSNIELTKMSHEKSEIEGISCGFGFPPF